MYDWEQPANPTSSLNRFISLKCQMADTVLNTGSNTGKGHGKRSASDHEIHLDLDEAPYTKKYNLRKRNKHNYSM